MLKKLKDFFKRLTGSIEPTAGAPVGVPQHPVGRQPEPRRRQRRDTQVRSGKPGTQGARKPHAERPQRPARPRRPHGEGTAEAAAGAVQWDPATFVVPPEEGKVRFHDFAIPPEVMHAIYDLGFQYCTPIQAGILGVTLGGKDASGRAQTGTGKTAAFLITILAHFTSNPLPRPRKKGTPRALILAPTRELVLQIGKDSAALGKYTNCTTLAVFGGMDYTKQQQVLRDEAVDIVAATPGRLLDFKRSGAIDLAGVEILVIDEADRMLDMGFIPDVRRIIESTPMKGKRQTMFFSATLTSDVLRLASAWTRDAVQVDVTPPKDITLATIDQLVYITTDQDKFTLLFNLLTKGGLERVMVFANRRDETQFLKARLAARGIRCGLLSGDVSQDQRVKTLEAFRSGKFKVLVATDVAARGLHIDGVSHVINYSLPMDPEDYLHRIGRTGRAGALGTSVSFATETESYEIPDIERFIGRSLPAVHPDPDLLTPLGPLAEGTEEPRKSTMGSSSRRGQRRGPPRGRRPRST